MGAIIKAILFDLDGVLVNSRVLHYETFRDALHEIRPTIYMSWVDHERSFDGLSTKLKIQKLVHHRILTESEGVTLWNRKQELTRQRLPECITPRNSLKQILVKLRQEGYRLFCCSNSIRATLDASLERLQVTSFFEETYANEDIMNPKPSPDIYRLAMEKAGLKPHECLIIEDSVPGKKAAYASGAHVLEVEDAEDLTESLLNLKLIMLNHIHQPMSRIAFSGSPTTFHIVIPMAGAGSRFAQAGYKDPKPFIQVGGKPMIQWVIENMIPKELDPKEFRLRFHLIVRTSHAEGFDFKQLFKNIECYCDFTIHTTDGLTEGATCSVLLAESEICYGDPLLIINSDQFLEWNPDVFYKCLMNPEYDGAILTFYQPDPSDTKWSFAKVSNDGLVEEVAEKKWISPHATVGLYGWKRGYDFVKYAKQMIEKNIRVNNEFYVCPVYNEAIADGKKVRVKLCSGMWGLGVPEDLEKFRREYCKE